MCIYVYAASGVCTNALWYNKAQRNCEIFVFGGYSLPWHFVSALAAVNMHTSKIKSYTGMESHFTLARCRAVMDESCRSLTKHGCMRGFVGMRVYCQGVV